MMPDGSPPADPGRPVLSPGRLWAGGVATAIVAAPFSRPAALASKVFTAVINLVAGVAVICLLTGVGSSAARPDDVQEPGAKPRMQPR